MSAAAGRAPADQPHGLMFHRFHGEGTRPLGQGSVSDRDFERILEHVGIERVLGPADWLERLSAGGLEDGDLCLTFDDGLRSQYEVARPILDRHGLKAFWFVFSAVFRGEIDRNEVYNAFATMAFESFEAFVENFLGQIALPDGVFESEAYGAYRATMRARHSFYTESDIRFRFLRNEILPREDFEAAMDRLIAERGLSVAGIAERLWMTDAELRRLHDEGHAIGLHSYSHPFVLAKLGEAEQRREYGENRRHIAAVTGAPVAAMSHPLNSYGPETLEILSDLGIACGFRSDMRPTEQLEIDRLPQLQIPRADSTDLLRAVKDAA